MSSQPPRVAVDLGAGSCRVSLLTWDGDRPAVRLAHRFANEPVTAADGSLRWPIDAIVAGVTDGLRRAAGRAGGPIASVAVDGWGVDYVRLSPDGITPAADPYCYRDARTATVPVPVPPADLYAATGVAQLRLNTLYQLLADRAAGHGPQPWVQLPEYVTMRLGGRRVAERTNATHTGLVGPDGRWAAPVFNAVGLDESVVPTLVPAGTVVGTVTGDLHPAYAGCRLVVPGCHDTASAVAGIPAAGDDWAYLSSGTWSLIGRVLDRPCGTPAADAAGFTNLGAVGGGVLFHRNVNGLWLLQQSQATWAAAGRPWAVADLVTAADRAATPDGLVDLDDADLLQPGDVPGRINRQRAARGLPAVADPPALARLIFASLAARYAAVLADLVAITGRPLRRLFVVGGGSQNELLNRMTANATGLSVERGPVESATIGNFAVQLAVDVDGRADAAAVARWAAVLRTAV